MNPLMGSTPQAPAPGAPTGAPAPPVATNNAAPPPMSPNAPNPMMGQQAPPQAPPPMPPPSPAQIKEARIHANVIVDGLKRLVAMPRGKLDKKEVFNAASDMIAKGAWPTAESKKSLIAGLANLPDDEPDLRKALGALLLEVSGHRDVINQAWPEAPPMAGAA